TSCAWPQSGSPTNRPLTLGKSIASTPTVTCITGGSSVVCSTVGIPTTTPDKVSLGLTETNNPVTNNSGPYHYTLTASLRPQNQTAPTTSNSSQAPLLLFGSGSCSSGATGLNVNASGTLRVYGSAYLNTTDGAGCSAMSLTHGGQYKAGSTSILSGGH